MPPFLKAQVTVTETHTNVSCSGGNNGSINITASGGTAPYTYQWNDGTLTEDRSNLTAGWYSLTVTDFNGNGASIIINIGQATPMSTSSVITPVTCGGGNDGAINFSVSGGTPGYTFLWSDGNTNEDRVNMTAANYYVTVTDAAGCQKVDSANITQPMGMVVSAVINDANCNASNGHINLTVQYGYPAYTYLWNDGNTNEDRVSLMIGTYTVTVTDQINCTVSFSATVNQNNNNININHTATNPTCFGSNNGSITITSVVGGVGPFTYAWSNGTTGAVNSGLTAGTYVVTVTTSTGCVHTKTITLTQPNLLVATTTSFPLTCFSSNNGAITTSVSGGTSPYSYNWGGGVFTQNRTGLTPGTYTVTVTDNKGCTATASGTITQPLQVAVTATPSPLACTGGPTGSVHTNVTGGTGSYSYWWGAGITTPHRINVNAGTYTVTVTDANGCTGTGSASIAAYTPLNLTTIPVNVTCYNGNNGAINLTVSNGEPPYSYQWSNAQNSEDLANIPSGGYAVTVEDSRSCTAAKTENITQPPFPIVIYGTVGDVNCYGGNDGSINITVNNGNPPFTYNWGGGINTQNRSNLTAGTYSVIVTDATNCTATASFTVTQPTQMLISSNVTDASCNGAANGVVHLNVTGGFAPYTYGWNNGGNTQVISNLAAGIYSVTVADTRNCLVTLSSTVNQPTAVSVTATTTHVTCFGANNGTINISTSGSTPPYTYNWNDNIHTQNRSGLAPAAYSVTVTDNTGCTGFATATIQQPAAIVVSETHTNDGCSGNGTGSISISVTGGTTPYNFNWSNGAGTQNISNINSGSYIVTVTDANLCSEMLTVSVAQNPSISVSASHTNVSCFGGNNGSISVNISSGTAPYTFVWNDNNTLQNRTGLAIGNYSVTVSDANNCTATTSATVSQPTAIVLSTSKTDATCFGVANGSIDLTVSGGTGNYAYTWSNNANTQNISGIAAGNYTVNVTDANNCIATASATINQPTAVNVSIASSAATCFGSSTASLTASATGGNGTYQYVWNTGASNPTLNNVAAGNYQVTATDAAGCSAMASATATQPSVIVITETITNVQCYGDNHGSISITATGGSGNYTYQWNTGSTSSTIINLTAAVYTVTVTDANGCSAVKSITISQPSQIQVTTNVTHVNCNGANTGSINLNVSGGVSPYQFSWSNQSNSQNLNNIIAGNYSVVITDANLCIATVSAVVNQAPVLQVALDVTNATCFGTNNGSITANVSGGTPTGNNTYNYNWSNNTSSSSITGIGANTYSVTVTDAANCAVSATAVVQQPAAIVITETHTNVTCNGNNNGSISITASGGAGNFAYAWNNGASTSALNNLAANTYTVTVTDGNLCAAQQTIIVTQPAAIAINETHTNYACTTSPGSIQLTVTGGNAPYNFNWADGSTSQNRTQLPAGNYSVVVTDANTCPAQKTISIAALTSLATSYSKQDVNCNAAKTGTIDLSVTGGTAPYQYVWNNGAATQDLQNLGAGTYDVLVQDANNCAATNSVIIAEPAAIAVATNVNDIKCYGYQTGIINVTVNGGSTPYTFAWNNGSQTQNLTGVIAGNYTVTVTDANGCAKTVSGISVSQPNALNGTSVVTQTGCAGNTGSIVLAMNGGTPPYSFNWSNNAVTEYISNLATGTYTATVTDNNGCVFTKTETVTQSNPVSVSGNAVNASCPEVHNGSIQLTVDGGTPAYTFNWSNGNQTQNLQQLPEGAYSVTVTDAQQCSATAAFNVSHNYVLQVDAGENQTVYTGKPVTLTATANVNHGNTYDWMPSDEMNCADCPSVFFVPSVTTTYLLYAEDANGCTAFDSVTVEVLTVTQPYIPNAFTPNGDGNNDVFQIYAHAGDVHFVDFKIFNRWGEKVFETNNVNDSWDGTYKGEPSANGVYVYVAKVVLADGTKNDYKGSVTIIR
ncbi:MAG: gliding motility-associated C-terminal domain-containing protein [Chitinophagales bacterium]|nr:gliding motility-associated C-terminal domain-containing protein [Chitinophagales bacterium]